MYIIEVLPHGTNKELYVRMLNKAGLWTIGAKELAHEFDDKETANKFMEENKSPNEYQFFLHVCQL